MDLAIGKRSCHHVAIAVLVILGWAAAAHAEDAMRHSDRAGRYLLSFLYCSGAHLIASGMMTP